MEINLLKIGSKINFKACKKVQYKTKNLHNWQRHTCAWKWHTKSGHANHTRVGPRHAKVLLIIASRKSVSSPILLSVVQQVFVLLRKVFYPPSAIVWHNASNKRKVATLQLWELLSLILRKAIMLFYLLQPLKHLLQSRVQKISRVRYDLVE